MGVTALAAVALLGSLASGVATAATAPKKEKRVVGANIDRNAELARKAEEARNLRGRASTLTTSGTGSGLSETPTLGRASLLGQAGG